MKFRFCIFMLVVLASMHGIIGAAGSLSILKNLHLSASLAQSPSEASAECCDEDAIEFSKVAYHCPLDGKILASGIEISPRTGRQVHVPAQVNQLGAVSFSAFFRPPIS